MTYVSEMNAQFAKESMACQSLDNDEILNVRWATEDPNPTSKVQEQERLEELGKKAIQERMDPRIVDAMRSVRALEEGAVEETGEGDEMEEEQRRELEGLADGGMEDADADATPSAKRRRIEAPGAEQPKGLLNADTIEGLKFFADIRKRHENKDIVKPSAAPKPATTGISLNYASDSDDD